MRAIQPMTKSQIRCLKNFAGTDQHNVKSPTNQDFEAMFELTEMGLLDSYFNGCIDDHVAYITPAGRARLAETEGKG